MNKSEYQCIGAVEYDPILCYMPDCKNCKLDKCIQDMNLIKLTSDLKYIFPLNNFMRELRIKRGFVTDGSSVPQGFWSLVGHPLEHKFLRPAILHDALYGTHLVTRKEADCLFYKYLTEFQKLNKLISYLMYISLRAFGGYHWGKASDKLIRQRKKFVSII